METTKQTKTKIEVLIRYIRDVKLSRAYGFTKNHIIVEFYFSGCWRIGALATQKQLEKGYHQDEIGRKIALNSGIKAEFSMRLYSKDKTEAGVGLNAIETRWRTYNRNGERID